MDTIEPTALAALSARLTEAVATAGASILYVDANPRRDASGIAWDEHHVVTVDHALEREDDIELRTAGGATARATLVGRDPSTDVVLLQTAMVLVPAKRADPSALAVGNLVLAVGRDEDGEPGASFGIVSSLDGPWRTWRGGNVDRFIRPDVNVYRGFSGGALVDATGALIGMNTWGLSRRTALTLPTTTLERIVRELTSAGRVQRGYLGVALQSVRVPESLRIARGLAQRNAALVVDAARGGPAESAGIMLGDIVVALGNATVEDGDDLQRALDGIEVGSLQTVHLLRGGEAHDVAVTIGERPRDGE